TLNGMPISAGTTGGTVTPSTVTTDAAGKAKASFKMGSGKSAIIDAHHVYEKPYGCEYVKLGSTPIGGIPVKVELSYIQNETRWIKRATLPGIKIKGGLETEQYVMFHIAVLYHYPSVSNLKKGYLVIAENEDPEPGSKTEFILEDGYYDFTKKVEDAKIMGMAGNIEMVQDVEKGSQQKIEGLASLAHHTEIMFTTGNSYEPASFMWNVQYPATGEDIAGGGATIIKGEEGVKWVVNKITDPNSPYKTEYLLSLKLDAEEELKNGNKAMKGLFGKDLDELTGVLDPTNPQSNMAGASGSQTITVRILSPYAETTSTPKK
ncbi:MAG: Ig-like domain-containing protein, partial [Kaistella sp.]